MLNVERSEYAVGGVPSAVSRMAAVLRTMGVDLSNEREVIRVLIGAKFTSSQVKNAMDHAITLAR